MRGAFQGRGRRDGGGGEDGGSTPLVDREYVGGMGRMKTISGGISRRWDAVEKK